MAHNGRKKRKTKGKTVKVKTRVYTPKTVVAELKKRKRKK